MRLSFIATAVIVVGLLAFAMAQTVNLQLGNYAFTTELTIPEMPSLPPVKGERCLTPDELRKLSSGDIGDLNQLGLHCKTSEYKLSGNKATFTLTCDDRTWNGEIILSGDSYSEFMRGRDKKGGLAVAKLNAKRIGECKR